MHGERRRAVRRLEPERSVGAVGVLVRDGVAEHRAEVPLVDHDQMVEALATQRADAALGDGVGLRGADGRNDCVDPAARRADDEVSAVARVAIPDERSGAVVSQKSVGIA